MLLNNQWITEEIKDKNQELTRDKMKIKARWSKTLQGCSNSSSKKEVYSSISLAQKQEKSQKQPKLTPKTTKKNKQKPKLVEGNKP